MLPLVAPSPLPPDTAARQSRWDMPTRATLWRPYVLSLRVSLKAAEVDAADMISQTYESSSIHRLVSWSCSREAREYGHGDRGEDKGGSSGERREGLDEADCEKSEASRAQGQAHQPTARHLRGHPSILEHRWTRSVEGRKSQREEQRKRLSPPRPSSENGRG